MKFKELQPYRVWYQYLQTCLNNKVLSKKVDKEYYKNWNLNLIKTTKFDKWFKTHQHLFVSKDKAKIVNKKTNDEAILLEIPKLYPISKIQKELPQILKGKIIETRLTHNLRNINTPALDSFHYAYKFRKKYPNKKLEDIWELCDDLIKKRQNKFVGKISIKKLVEQGKLRQRKQQGWGREPQTGKSGKLIKPKNKAIMISRNILKTQKILQNVCIGQFPGQYSDH
jgi:hypothetical protein